MRDIAFVFLLAAVLCVTGGMIWGIQMAVAEDYILAPAHAHFNLVGWVTLALYGLYYRLTQSAAQGIWPRLHATFAIFGAALIVPGIAVASQIAKCAPLRATHSISQRRQCRGAASSLGRSRRSAESRSLFLPLRRAPF